MAFTFLVSLLLAFLWLAGNAQGFLDATQASILAVLRWSLLAEIAAGVWTMGVLVARSLTERRLFPVRFALGALALLTGALLLAWLGFLQAWLRR